MDEGMMNRTITLKDLWKLLVQRLAVIALAAVAAMAVFGILNGLTYQPAYASTATLYILRQGGENASSGDASNDFSLALKVVGDCTYLLKSHSVIDEVKENLSLDLSYEDIYDSISTANPEDTRILEVTVTAQTPEMAKQIADELCQVGQLRIAEAMGFDQVKLFEHGTLDREPDNSAGLMTYALVGAAAAVMVYGVFLVIYLLDDRIRTEEDIEKILGLSILGEIPNADDTRMGRYGYYVPKAQNGKKQGGKR